MIARLAKIFAIWGAVAGLVVVVDVVGGENLTASGVNPADAREEWTLLQEFAAARRAAHRDLLREHPDEEGFQLAKQQWEEQYREFEAAYQGLQQRFRERSFESQLRASKPNLPEARINAFVAHHEAHRARELAGGDATEEIEDLTAAKEHLRTTFHPPSERDTIVAAANDYIRSQPELAAYLESEEGWNEIKELRRSIRESGTTDRDLVDIATALYYRDLGATLEARPGAETPPTD